MITQDQLRDVIGNTAYDGDGDKIGKIGSVYYDDNTDEPKWLTVHTGLFGGNETFVPLQGADLTSEGNVSVAYDKARVKDAPNVDEDGHLSVEDEEKLYRYYGLGSGQSGTAIGGPAAADERTGPGADSVGAVGDGDDGMHAADETRRTDGDKGRADYTEHDTAGRETTDRESTDRGTVGHDTSGPTTDQAMTRSEEELRVGTQTREAGRARLRKHVVTEQQQVTVPVSHEEVRIEREPITDANRGDAYDGPAISEEEHEVVLTEERPVVTTEAVAVERVRMGTETVQEQETVGGEVRKEVIDVDEPDKR